MWYYPEIWSLYIPNIAQSGLVEALSGWSGNKPGFDSGIVMSVRSMMSDCAAEHSGMQSIPFSHQPSNYGTNSLLI